MKTPASLPTAIYLDLEMNCPDRLMPGADEGEIVEVGLVELNVVSLEIVRERNYLVRPHRPISRRCTRITGLTDEDFKGAKLFREAIAEICAEWPGKATAIAWGEDGAILTRACRQHHLRTPFRRFLDLSKIFQQALLLQDQPSLRAALDLLGLPFDGNAHMAVTDARNTARIHAEIVRRLRGGSATFSPAPETKPTQPTWFGQLLANSLKTIHPA